MSSSPKKPRKLPPRPKITLPVPGQFPGHYPQTPMGYVTTPYGQTPVPLTPVSGQPTIVYTNKASEFVFAHLKGFKDFTKSGLSVGEKSAFWLYEKVSSWSKRWFTHIFLFFVLFLYSILGAFAFNYIEGKYEHNIQVDIKRERDEMIQQIRDLWKDKELMEDSEKWKGHAKNHLMLYEEKLYKFLKSVNFQSHPDSVNWAFWNAVIYCSTIYTTIVDNEGASSSMMDEDEERRARMERMVEDTERMELMVPEGGDGGGNKAEEEQQRPRSRQRQLEPEEQPPTKARSRSPAVNRPEVAPAPREDELKAASAPPKKESPPKREQQQQPEEEPPQPPVKTSRRARDTGESELRRRMGSPETTARQRSTLSPSHEDQPDPRMTVKKRSSSRHRYPSDDEEPPSPPPTTVHRSKSRRSPSQPVKKQIIPLSNESLMEDVARAKRAYAHREPSDEYEYEYDEEEEEEEEYVPRRRREMTVRRRKTSVMHTDQEKEDISNSFNQPSSWFSWIPFFGWRKQKVEDMIEESDKKKEEKKKKREEEEAPPKPEPEPEEPPPPAEPESDKVTIGDFFRAIRDINAEFSEFCRQNPEEVQILQELRNLCIVETIITLIVCGLGGFAFRFTEGAFESFYKCGVKRVKRDFLDSLWSYSHNMKEDDWKSMARRKLMDFEEQLHAAHEAGVQTYSGQRSWTFLNAMVYCLTVITTIGYGHISPSTTTGRALTIVYAIFGIPMFLIVLADFGKLFTRGIKFLWAFVRRLYYTGSCRKVRRTVPMQEMMKGVQMVYDLATFRRPSQMSPEELQEIQRQQLQQQQTVLGMEANASQQPESPSTPAMSAFEIDDEFNLPISVAITILIVYIFIGATIFNIFEEWTFFESFYFVFISMSTIGFGDFVPKEPLYMMLSIVYMIFGLALTSMCINVVQVMLVDQFKQASQKIGASIGFHVSDEDGSLKPAPPEPVEIAEVHHAGTTTTASPVEEKVAPKAKLDDGEL